MKLHKKVFVKRGAHSTSLDQCVNLFLKVFIKKLKLSKKSFKLNYLDAVFLFKEKGPALLRRRILRTSGFSSTLLLKSFSGRRIYRLEEVFLYASRIGYIFITIKEMNKTEINSAKENSAFTCHQR